MQRRNNRVSKFDQTKTAGAWVGLFDRREQAFLRLELAGLKDQGAGIKVQVIGGSPD
jgi:hypothetical protein